MARVSQFAKDLGISYNQAKDLVNKGRSRKDGGSQILESIMKPKKYEEGGSNKVTKEDKKKKKKKKKNTKNKIKPVSKRFEGTPITFELTEDMIGGRGRGRVLLPDITIDPKDFLQRPIMPSVEGEDFDPRMIQRKFGGATLTSKEAKKIKKTMSKKPKDPMGDLFGKDKEFKFRDPPKKPNHPKYNPKVKKKSEGGLGMQSVKYGLDNNPAITAADPKAKFIAANKKAGGGMPKMPEYRDGGTTRKKMQASGARRTPSVRKNEPKEILTPFKGVLKTSKGETLRNIDGKTFLVKPNPKFKKRMRRMRDGGAFRGCGAQVKGKKFKGIF